MPAPGADGAWEEGLPSPGDGTSWDEADYSWDPLSMTATALRSPAGPRHTQEAQAGRGARPSLAPRSAGCSAAAGVDKFIASLVHAGGASEADSQGGTPSPADGTSGGAGGGGGAGGATAAAAAAAAQASDEEGGGGAAPPPTRARGTRQRKAGGGGAAAAAAAAAPCVCQADGCGADLTSLTFYFKRNKICTVHIKADAFSKEGQQLRFCQRCGHAHLLAEFDPGKHSCRKQLERHNARRRKRQQQQQQQGSRGGVVGGWPAAEQLDVPPLQQQQQQQAQQRQQGAQRAKRSSRGKAPAEQAGAVPAPAAAAAPQAPAAPQALAPAVLAPPAALHPPASPHHSDASAAGFSGAAAAGGPQRPTSPLLPLLCFELDELQPTPLEEVFKRQAVEALPPGEASLAEELASWLNSNLDADSAQLALQVVQPMQQQQAAAAGLQAAAGQHQAWAVAASAQAPAVHHQSSAWHRQPSSLAFAQGVMRQDLLPVDPCLYGQAQQAQQAYQPWHAAPPPGGTVALGIPVASQHPVAPSQPALQQQQQQQASPAATAATGGAAPASSSATQLPGGSSGLGGAVGASGSGGGSSPPALATVSVKLFGCTPAELPPGLRDHLTTWFDGAVHSIEGYLRPGCVHLTVQALLDGMLAAAQQRVAAQEQEERQVDGARQQQDAAAATEAARAPAAAPAAGACCGRKRAADSPAGLPRGSDGAVQRVVARMLASGEALWRTKTMLVQAGAHVALVHKGRLQKTWDIEGAPSARAVPAILEVTPPLALAGQPGQLRVTGLNMLQNDCLLLLRLQGRYVQPVTAMCTDCACAAPVHPASGAGPAGVACAAAAAASFERRCCGCCINKLQLVGLLPRAAGAVAPAGEPPSCCQHTQEPAGQAAAQAAAAPAGDGGWHVSAGAAHVQGLRLQLPGAAAAAAAGQPPLLPGLLHLDLSRRAFTAPRGASVLVVASPAVHAELLQLVESRGRGALPQPLLDQLGVVHEWLGRPEKMQYGVVEATAARLLFWAVSSGLPATAGLLLSVLQAEGGSSAAAAAAVLHRAVQPEAAGVAASAALAGMDGLSQLHLSMQATSAAAMQRAAELACRDGLSLLHRAVQSGSPDTLAAVLAWGEDAGSPWRCDLAGPLGVSPLHLAAVLPTHQADRQAVLLLLSRCPPGASAWDCCCAADGQTPAAFFRAAAGAAAADALDIEVAVLSQLQAPAAAPAPAPTQQQQQQQEQQQQHAVTLPSLRKPRQSPGAQAAERAAAVAPTELQPGTPRRNPGCMCAPGCPCALLDRCACCADSSDDDEAEGDKGSPAAGTCGAGSGKCCCCSGERSLPGCAGCEAGDAASGAAPAGGGGACCGTAGASPAAAPRACCGGK